MREPRYILCSSTNKIIREEDCWRCLSYQYNYRTKICNKAKLVDLYKRKEENADA